MQDCFVVAKRASLLINMDFFSPSLLPDAVSWFALFHTTLASIRFLPILSSQAQLNEEQQALAKSFST
jgi:hypothetical protein